MLKASANIIIYGMAKQAWSERAMASCTHCAQCICARTENAAVIKAFPGLTTGPGANTAARQGGSASEAAGSCREAAGDACPRTAATRAGAADAQGKAAEDATLRHGCRSCPGSAAAALARAGSRSKAQSCATKGMSSHASSATVSHAQASN